MQGRAGTKDKKMKKGLPGEICYRSTCSGFPAIGFNRSNGEFYCRKCSLLINKENEKEAIALYGDKNLVILPEHIKHN